MGELAILDEDVLPEPLLVAGRGVAARLARFYAKIKVSKRTGCWNWTGHVMETGYGQFGISDRKVVPAARYSYSIHKGHVPFRKDVTPGCKNKRCVNPDHLQAVERKTSLMRGDTWRHLTEKTHCSQGHPFSGSNLHIHANGSRVCRNCRAAAGRAYRARQKEKAKQPRGGVQR